MDGIGCAPPQRMSQRRRTCLLTPRPPRYPKNNNTVRERTEKNKTHFELEGKMVNAPGVKLVKLSHTQARQAKVFMEFVKKYFAVKLKLVHNFLFVSIFSTFIHSALEYFISKIYCLQKGNNNKLLKNIMKNVSAVRRFL